MGKWDWGVGGEMGRLEVGRGLGEIRLYLASRTAAEFDPLPHDGRTTALKECNHFSRSPLSARPRPKVEVATP